MSDVAQIGDLRVASVGSSDARLNVLVFMGLRACVDAFELQRFALMADEWDARLTVVDTPGYGHGSSRLCRLERAGLIRGNFTQVARRMVRAARDFEPGLDRRPVTVVGYSLGTSIAAAAAADPGLVRVRHLLAVEPVAMRVRNPIRLLSMAHTEDTHIPEYRERNPNWVATEQSDAPATRRDLALLGFALSRGCLTRDLLRARYVQRFKLHIVHGRDSLMCRAPDVTRLVTVCRRAGMEVKDITVEGRHALWQSYPDFAAVARRTRELVY